MDRNDLEIDGVSYDVWSLSARRAWIEIPMARFPALATMVALRKESVDRNSMKCQERQGEFCRSPQGERG